MKALAVLALFALVLPVKAAEKPEEPPAYCVERHGTEGEAFDTCVRGCNRVKAVASGIAVLCRFRSAEPEDAPTFEAARRLLVLAGIREEDEFEGVEFRFCPLVPAAGMAPAPELILIRPEYRGLTLPVAALLGHEMIHIDQYRRWGAEEFACRYGAEVAAERGTAIGNAVEDEAYSGDEGRAERLRRARLLPLPRPVRERPEG